MRHAHRSPERHIVDLLIDERAPTLLRAPGERMADASAGVSTVSATARPSRRSIGSRDSPAPRSWPLPPTTIGLRVRTLGTSRLPPHGRVVIAVNHPTGLADGVALWRALAPIRGDLRILANADALRIAPGLADIFIPVQWQKSQRSASDSRRVLADLGRALRNEAALVFFPSGRLAYLRWRGLTERPWLPTVVTVARKFGAPDPAPAYTSSQQLAVLCAVPAQPGASRRHAVSGTAQQAPGQIRADGRSADRSSRPAG